MNRTPELGRRSDLAQVVDGGIRPAGQPVEAQDELQRPGLVANAEDDRIRPVVPSSAQE